MNADVLVGQGEQLLGTLKEFLATQGLSLGLKILGVFVLFIIARIVAGSVRKTMTRGFERTKFDPTLSKFFSNMAYAAILVLAVLSILGIFGIQTASFAAVIAAAGLAIGLAFQGTLSNFSAGVMLLVFRPFKVGDVVNAAGTIGVIEQIDLFTTAFDTFDKRRIIVPNSAIASGTIENITHHPVRRIDLSIGVSYSADIDKTREVLEAAVASVEGVEKEPAHQIMLMDLGASSVDWVVRCWAEGSVFWPTRERLVRAIKMHLDEAGIEIPFPQMDVHFDQPVGKA